MNGPFTFLVLQSVSVNKLQEFEQSFWLAILDGGSLTFDFTFTFTIVVEKRQRVQIWKQVRK